VLGQEVHGENADPVDDEEPVDEEIIIVEGGRMWLLWLI
jgi:hypothetical protein